MKQVYIANDGELFDTEEDCIAHDNVLANKTLIEGWAKAKFEKAASATRALNTILLWEADRDATIGSQN